MMASELLEKLGRGLIDETMPAAEWRGLLVDLRVSLESGGLREIEVAAEIHRQRVALIGTEAVGLLGLVLMCNLNRPIDSACERPEAWSQAEYEEFLQSLRLYPRVLADRASETLEILCQSIETSTERLEEKTRVLGLETMQIQIQLEQLKLQQRAVAAAEAAAARNGPSRWEHATPSEKRACALRVAKGRLSRRERARRMAREYEGEGLEGAINRWLDRQERSHKLEARGFVRELTALPPRRSSAEEAMGKPTASASSPARRSKTN
jgi:hypothetical protein